MRQSVVFRVAEMVHTLPWTVESMTQTLGVPEWAVREALKTLMKNGTVKELKRGPKLKPLYTGVECNVPKWC